MNLFDIFDYVKEHKDVLIEDFSWNVIDNLICAILAYLPTEGFEKTKSLKEIYEEVKEVNDPEKLGAVEPKSIDMIKLLLDCSRYREMEVSNFVKIKNENTQFGAVTFRINNITIVSFQGTDYSTIGWLEDFRFAYEYPTYTQELAIGYLKDTLHLFSDNEVYVVGHSKGGTLAMTSVMESSLVVYNKIKKVYNFDGPGFLEAEYRSKKYRRLSRKLVNIVPTGSTIGVLLNNKHYQAVKANALGFNGHFPTNWRVYKRSFVKGRLSYLSNQIHKSTTVGLKKVDKEILKEAVETLFSALSEDKTADIKLSLEKIVEVYMKLKLENPKTFECLDTIFNAMVSGWKAEEGN